MHVLFTLDSLEIGGTELNAVRTTRELVRAGNRVTVGHLSPRGALLGEFSEAGADLLPLPVFGLASTSSLNGAKRLYTWLRGNRPDVVHSQDVYANIFSIPVARLANIRTVVGSRRWVTELAKPSLAIANKFACRLAHRVTANSPSALRAAEGDLGRKRSNVRFVPNFIEARASSVGDVDLAREGLAAAGVPTDKPIIGCVAQLRPVKRHDILLRAFAQSLSRTDASLVIVGDGPERDRLEVLAAELDVSNRVFFRGAVRSTRNLHLGFDVSILLSDCEASPNSLLEAAAAGIPIIASRVGGIEDIFTHEKTALLTIPSSSESAAACLIRMLDSPSLRSSLATESRKLAAQFSPESTVAALMDCYSRSQRRHQGATHIVQPRVETSG